MWTANGVGFAKTVNVPSGAVTIWVTENPAQGATEEWDIYNFTADAHPIHLHLVRFEVVERQAIGGAVRNPEPWESGFKDTVIAYPGEITTVKALFDIAGLYVWHCHIVEHEDNEMMRPYFVGD
jgi:FtsP/CotA-like multicopper oxidase with cupredoxin domain